VVVFMPSCSPGRAPCHIGRRGELPARPGVADPAAEQVRAPPQVAGSGSVSGGIPGRPARHTIGVVNRVTALLGRIPQPLAARVAALPPRRQELLADAGLGVALAVVNVVSLLPYRDQLHPLWLALILVATQGLPLAWRRYQPIGVAIVVGGVRVAYDQIGFGFAPFPLGPAIALYTILDRRGAAWRWITCVLVATAIGISQAAPGHHQPYDTIFQVMIFTTAAAAGLLSRAMRASVQAAHSRADRAEAELDRQSSQAAERERIRIARELHDVVAHHVSLIAVQAEAATALLPGRPDQAQRSVEVIGDTARQALTELRRLLGVLRRPSARLETAPTASLSELGDVLDQVRGAGLPVDFEITGTPVPLAPGVDLTAYRIVQEALTNTIRHAGAARAAVRLCYEPGYITVSVTDSGRPEPAAGDTAPVPDVAGLPGRSPLLAGAGLGLAGIAERVASCGGNLTVGPTQADGFAVTARLPSR
jgi:signal transduction histidine kinase